MGKKLVTAETKKSSTPKKEVATRTRKSSTLKGNGKNLSVNQAQEIDRRLITMSTIMLERAGLAGRLGSQYGGDRDLYEALGYKENLDYNDYDAQYERGELGSRIVDAPVEGSWKKQPKIVEDEKSETNFEKEWTKLCERLKVWNNLQRVDRISGIGRYGVLLIGFDDVKKPEDMKNEVTKAKDIVFLRPLTETHAAIQDWVIDPSNERYGLPLTYKLTLANAQRTGNLSPLVHHSRLIHIAENIKEDTVYGTPRMKKVFNRLYDIEKVCGGSGEMFWRGAFPGYAFEADADAQMDGGQSESDLQDEIEDYMHGLKRYLRTQGINVKAIESQVASPQAHFQVFISLISIASGIPQRILMGSERGELASTQDERAWNDRMNFRRRNYVEKDIIRPFINRIGTVGILKVPEKYVVQWEDLQLPDEKEVAEVQFKKTETIAKYASTPEIETIIPPHFFLTEILGYDEEKVKMLESEVKEIEKEIEEEESERIEREEKERKDALALEQSQQNRPDKDGRNPQTVDIRH